MVCTGSILLRRNNRLNPDLVNLLNDANAVATLRDGLPYAFELAAAEAGRVQMDRRTGKAKAAIGQEVGVHREHVLEGFLIRQLGSANVRLPMPGMSGVDTLVHGMTLEIKTATKRGLVTAKWTADNESADQVLREFQFASDMFLVRIWWYEERDSVFYIPIEVLQEAADSYPKFLKSQTGTNNRGVKIEDGFMKLVESHEDTLRVPIRWQPSGRKIESPTDRYTKYWIDGNFPKNSVD